MSRIGKKPIQVPEGVKVEIAGRRCSISGPKGSFDWRLPDSISAEYDAAGKMIRLARSAEGKHAAAMYGTSRAVLANMMHGVSQGYHRRLLIYGTGYSCNLKGGALCLNVGFMGRGSKEKPQFEIRVPDGLEVEIETAAARGEMDPAKFVVRGCDKQLVGQFAAEVRKIRPPEPYKGKGIRYEGESVRRKQGKAFASGGS